MNAVAPEERILNSEQKKAVEFGDGPVMIIAGAGTGKTTVVTERIRYLISSGRAKPDEILALTFTEKAAREMEERVDQLLPYGYTQMWISTFHTFCDRLLRSEAIHVGLSPAFRLLSDADATQLVRRNLFSFQLDYFRPLGNPTKFIGGMLTHFSRLHDEDISPQRYAMWVNSWKKTMGRSEEDILEVKKYEELAHAFGTYETLKIKEGFMDFANLITNTLVLFRTRPNILAQYQKKFKYILIDEFQDTNIAQNELILFLSQGHKNITVVCDDDQSIYKFRGAAVSNVLSFRKHFHDAQLIVLSKNYRSLQSILDASYQLIQHNNPDRLEEREGINKKLVAQRKEKGSWPEFLYADRVENEAELVAKKILDLKKNKNSFHWKDVAVLVRANNHADPFVRAFMRQDIPFQFLGPGQLYRQPEIKDLIAYLQVLDNFENNVALFRVLSMEFFGILGRDISAIANFAKKQNISLYEACEKVADIRVNDETKEKITQLISMISRHLGLLTQETGGQLLYYFLQDTGMMKSILSYTLPLDETRAGNISKFFNKIKTYEVEHEDASVSAVLDWILLSMELGESPLASDTDWTERDAVNILTVHSAKGLEFPIVFVVNLVAQRFPTNERKEQIPLHESIIKEELPVGDVHLEEERRLFYVAMTRARDLLFVTAANFYGEGKREKKLSPFIEEVFGPSIKKPVLNTDPQLSLLEWKKEGNENMFKSEKKL